MKVFIIGYTGLVTETERQKAETADMDQIL